eukprot:scaffold244_cov372-Pavlova_lutheri.AAC.5
MECEATIKTATMAVDASYRDHEGDDLLAQISESSMFEEEGVSFIVGGYHTSRVQLIEHFVCKHSKVSFVKWIHVNWGSNQTVPDVNQFRCSQKLSISHASSSSLNDRLVVPHFIKTNCIGVVDDDIVVSLRAITFAYQMWRENPDRMVGFFPRSVYSGSYYPPRYRRESHLGAAYHLILTKFLLVSKKFLDIYSKRQDLKAIVDKYHNCEDIALNYVVANFTGKGPIHLSTKVVDFGDSRNKKTMGEYAVDDIVAVGLGQRKQHKGDRSRCISAFRHLMGHDLPASYHSFIPSKPDEALCWSADKWSACDQPGILQPSQSEEHLPALSIGRPQSLFAFATLASSTSHIEPLCLLAKMLRYHGTMYDILLFVPEHMSRKLSAVSEVRKHFDAIIPIPKVSLSRKSSNAGGYMKIYIWKEIKYSKILYLDYDVLILDNIDHLFVEYEAFAAAPDVYVGDIFNSGVMLLKPDLLTAADMLEKVDHVDSYNKGDQGFFNWYFDWWYTSEAKHRLPFKYNFIYHLERRNGYQTPTGWSLEKDISLNGHPFIVHFANRFSKPWQTPVAKCTYYQILWKKWAAGSAPNLYQSAKLQPALDISRFVSNTRFHHRWSNMKFAMATYFEGGNVLSTLILARSLQDVGSSYPLIVLVPSYSVVEVETELWQCNLTSIIVKETSTSGWAGWLDVWSLTDFTSILFLSNQGMVLRNLDHVFDMFDPLASVPSTLPPDTASGDMLLLQPNRTLCQLLHQEADNWTKKYGDHFGFLQSVTASWFASSPSHRLPASYRAEAELKPYVQHFRKFLFFRFHKGNAPWEKASLSELIKCRLLHPLGSISSLKREWLQKACQMKRLHDSLDACGVCKY